MHKSTVWTLGIFSAVILLASLVSVASSSRMIEADPGRLLPGETGTGGVDLGTIIVQFDAEQTAKVISQLDKEALTVSKGTGIEAVDSLASKFNVQSMSPVFEALYRAADGQPAVDDERASFYLLQLGEPAGTTEDLLGMVAEFGKVCKSAQFNYEYEPDRVPNDPMYPDQWSHKRTDAEAGWDFLTDEKTTIAIIGSGVQLDHPDLAGNIWENTAEIPGNGIDDDHNGYIDDRKGWNFYPPYNNDPSPPPQGSQRFHETRVAGVAAADTDNAEGVAGVCWTCKIMALRTGDGGQMTGKSWAVAAAIDYATNNGASVINMSFGSYQPDVYGPDTVVEWAVNRAYAQGLTIVSTAGNTVVGGGGADNKRYPGALKNVICVSSTDLNDDRSQTSNYGSWVDVAAPGKDIWSTNINGGYAMDSGTSYAAPYVAGLAGLLRSRYPGLSPFDTRLRIEYNVDKIDTDFFIGSGRVNVYKAVHLDQNPTLFAVIKSPLKNTVIPSGTGTLEIVGTALATGGKYVLEVKPHDSSNWTELKDGGQTIDGVLGGLKVDSVPPGYYDIRLRAIVGGSEDVDQITVRLGGEVE